MKLPGVSKVRRYLYFAITTLLILTAVELGIRLAFGNRVFGLRVYRSITESPGYGLAPTTDCDMVQAGRSLHISIDATGDRVTPSAPTSSTIPVIHLIGDSQVFGQGLSDNETVSNYLQAKMGDRFKVINHGVPGYGPFAYRRLLQSIPANDWAVVVQTEYNDLRDSYSERTRTLVRCGYLLPDTPLGHFMPCFGLNLRLFQLTSQISGAMIGGLKPLPINYDPHDSVAAKVLMYRVEKLYEDERKKRGAKLIFTVLPWDASLVPSRLRMYSPRLEKAVSWVEFPDECDMKGHFLKVQSVEDLYLPYDEHISSTGASLVATVIYDKLHERMLTVDANANPSKPSNPVH